MTGTLPFGAWYRGLLKDGPATGFVFYYPPLFIEGIEYGAFLDLFAD